MARIVTASLLLLLSITGARAEIAGFPFQYPEQEQQFRHLSEQLRCLVCQNQTLGDSAAGLAQDLRRELYDQVLSGASDQQIIDFMTERYGDFILYKPRFAAKNYALWFAPFLLLVAGIFGVVRFARNRATGNTGVPKESELQQIRTLLQNEEDPR